jgi:cobyric acid synthase CobQ
VRHPTATLVVDEAFADFVDGYGSLARQLPANLIVVRSLTKFYAIPGLRLGFAVSQPDVAAAIRCEILPWSVNSLAQAAGVAVLADQDYPRQTLALLASVRRQLVDDLTRLPGLHVYDGAANYLLVRVDRADVNAVQLARRLLCQGIAIRTFDASQHLDERFFRVAVRGPKENERLIEALAEAVDGGRRTMDGAGRGKAEGGKRNAELVHRPSPLATRRNKTPALMIQGTSSNAGKSVLVAALGRILLQDGVRVAPFKSQNMSLNSFVTCDGGEMGRAQVVQAQACRLEPDVRMNPILLKPNSETGSQVIVRGRPVGNMNVAEYIRFKGQAAAAAQECYEALAAEFDVMLLEGAGSPGEVNLKSHDIVNMRMAEYAAAPVLIVGDIDRGGVFASFVGTMEVLAPWERQLVAGWIVNRFRGDAALLQPALDYTRLYTGRPVLGVVPYLAAIDLPQEDSVEFKSGALDSAPSNGATVEIAVIDLPHISNFTDFDAFRSESDVHLRIIRTVDQLQTPDAVIIPGSKNTLDDLAYLRCTGLARRIAALAGEGATEVVGVCGGFQMLGGEVHDPLGIESSNGDTSALGLIDAHTVLAAEKTLVRTTARHQPSGLEVAGYEIHHGQTTLGSAVAWFIRSDGQVVGAARPDQRVWGTYLHGVFDADGFRRWFIDRFRVRRGMSPLGIAAGHYDIEPALDRLADAVRQSIRMDEIYRLLKI